MSKLNAHSMGQRRLLYLSLAILVLVTGCIRTRPDVVIVTSQPAGSTPETAGNLSPAPDAATTFIVPTLDPTRPARPHLPEYIVQPGDTLSGIALQHGVTLDTLIAANDLLDPNVLTVGQVVRLPAPPDEATPRFKVIPDSRLVRGPDSPFFDISAFVNQQSGYVRIATDNVNGEVLTAADVVRRVSLEFSVDARLLLALLEYRAGWLSDLEPADALRIHPLGAGPSPAGIERDGLYRQLTWAADQLNTGYYGWKYRGLDTLGFEDGTRVRFAAGLNAATVGAQYMLSQFNDYVAWWQDVGPEGFYRTYSAYFGDPFADAIEPLLPADMEQPLMTLPFAEDEVWFYTGGPHGGWGNGSAWAAIDFAPPDDLTDVDSTCYVSDHWATAVASGVIARTGDGVVVLDLDGDGDEATGWSILYLHLAADGRIEAHTMVNAGDKLGKPSCEGGFSNGTHLHIARRYNGEWVRADCESCPPEQTRPPFVLGDWVVIGFPGQVYQGAMVNGDEGRIAEQGRLTPDNLISW